MALLRRKESKVRQQEPFPLARKGAQKRGSMGDRLPADMLRGVWRYARQNLDDAREEAAAKGLPQELSFLMVANAIRKSVAQIVKGKYFLLTVQEDQKIRRRLQGELVGEIYKLLHNGADDYEDVSGKLVSTLKRALPEHNARNVSEESVKHFAYGIWTSAVRFQEHREFVKRASQEIEELGASASGPSLGPQRRPAADAAQSGVCEAVDGAVDKIMGAGRRRQSVVTRASGSLAEGLKKPNQKRQFKYLQSLVKEGLDEMESEHESLIKGVFKMSRAFFGVEQIKVKLPVEPSDDADADASTAAQPRGPPPVTWKPPNRKNLDRLLRRAARRSSIVLQFSQIAASGIAKARASAGDEASVEEDAAAAAAAAADNLREAVRTGAARPGAARRRRPEEGAAAAAEGRGARGTHGEGAGGDELPQGEDRDAFAVPGSGERLAGGKATGLGGGAGAADSGEEPGELSDGRRRGRAASHASSAGSSGCSDSEDSGDEEASLDSDGISEDEALLDLQRRARTDKPRASMMFFSDKDKAILQRLELGAARTVDRADGSAPGEGDFGAGLAAAGGGVLRQLALPESATESSDFGGSDFPTARGGGGWKGVARLSDAAREITQGVASRGASGESLGKEKLSLELTGRRLSQASAATESPSAAARAKGALAGSSAIAHSAATIQREFLRAKTSHPAVVKRWSAPQQSPRVAALALAMRQPKPIARGQRPRQALLPEEEPTSGLRLPALVASPRRYERGDAAVVAHAVIVEGPSWRAAAQAQASAQVQARAALTMPRAATSVPRSARGPTRPKGHDLPHLLSAREGSKVQPPHVVADDPGLQPLSRVKRIRADALAALQPGTLSPPPRSSGGAWSAAAKTRSYARQVVGLACVVPNAPRGPPLRGARPGCGEDVGGDASWTLWDRLGSVY